MKIGYLGPEGSFTEQAANYYKNKNTILIPFKTNADVLKAVDSGEVDQGVVPIENTTEGSVNMTLDTLIFDTNLYIKDRLVLPIKQSLMVNKNNLGNKIEKIYSHPQALAQCRNYLEKNYKLAQIIEVDSTSFASKKVSNSKENIASIGTSFASKVYNLSIVEDSIQDRNDNRTYFILVSKDSSDTLPKPKYITSLAFTTLNKPGELYKILDIFSLWDINMTKIISRPMKGRSGEYVFFVEVEDFSNEEDALDAFKMIERKSSFFKILGTFKDNIID